MDKNGEPYVSGHTTDPQQGMVILNDGTHIETPELARRIRNTLESKLGIKGGTDMSVKDVAAGLGGLLLMLAFAAVGIVIVMLFFYGAAWASRNLLPWFSVATWVAFAIVVFILLPLAIPRATRGFSSVAMFIASYVFGATLWMMGLLLTLSLWGITAVIIGIVLGGVGVVPIAMLATLFHGYLLPLVELVLLTVATFGCRIGALSLAQSLEQQSYA